MGAANPMDADCPLGFAGCALPASALGRVLAAAQRRFDFVCRGPSAVASSDPPAIRGGLVAGAFRDRIARGRDGRKFNIPRSIGYAVDVGADHLLRGLCEQSVPDPSRDRADTRPAGAASLELAGGL